MPKYLKGITISENCLVNHHHCFIHQEDIPNEVLKKRVGSREPTFFLCHK